MIGPLPQAVKAMQRNLPWPGVFAILSGMPVTYQRPAPLPEGGTIALIAPAGPFDEAEMTAGVAAIERRGYRCKLAEGLKARSRYLAGGDEHRLRQLVSAFEDPEASAVWCVRGGYGAMRLLPQIHVEALPSKPLVGFSDVTALHAAWQVAGRMSIHGPVITRIAHEPAPSADRLFALLRGSRPPAIQGGTTLRPGRAEGRLIGGNLATFSRLVGTRWFPDLRGAILLVEDVAERPYRLDRMWTHLKLAGVFDGLAGVAVGRLDRCEEPNADYTALDVMRDLVGELNVPAVIGLPIGHVGDNFAVMLGAPSSLDATAGSLENG
jgi:muramoyltetrapeptide carboxypeptidase